MASLCRATRLLVPRISRNARYVKPVIYQPVVFSSTSESKKSEFVVGKSTDIDPARVEEIIREGQREPTDDVNDPNWVSHGWSETDPVYDSMVNKVSFFFTVSIALVFGALFAHYLPDTTGRIWAEREAMSVIAEREIAGLPLINPNFIDPNNIILPAEEDEDL